MLSQFQWRNHNDSTGEPLYWQARMAISMGTEETLTIHTPTLVLHLAWVHHHQAPSFPFENKFLWSAMDWEWPKSVQPSHSRMAIITINIAGRAMSHFWLTGGGRQA